MPQKPVFNNPWPDNYDQIISKLVEIQNIACEELTEKQLTESIKQAISCGDFIRQVRVSDNAQAIIYIPYAREQKLLEKIKELEKELEEAKSMFNWD